MKFFALPRNDGGVEIMQLAPIAARGPDGKEVKISRIVNRDDGWAVTLANAGKEATAVLPRLEPPQGFSFVYSTPEDEIARWHPARRAEITGASHEIAEADYRAAGTADPARKYREAWKFDTQEKTFRHDSQKKAEIDARPIPKTERQELEELKARLGLIEAKDTGRLSR